MSQTAAPLQSNQPGANQIGQPGAPAQQQDTPLSVTPSPMQMPGAAAAAMNAPQQTMHAPKEIPVLPNQQDASSKDGSVGEKPAVDANALQARADGLQTLARKFEQSAKDNQADADAFRKLQDLFGSGNDGAGQVDPIAEITKLRGELDSERTERVRAEVSRLTGVPPSLIIGADAEAMATSAQAALEWGNGLGGRAIGVPAVAPADVVNSDGKPGAGKPQQITTRDELKGMSSRSIMEAYNNGQLDKMLGR
jgi:hypothetical protein